jgi:hypothetical protein
MTAERAAPADGRAAKPMMAAWMPPPEIPETAETPGTWLC